MSRSSRDSSTITSTATSTAYNSKHMALIAKGSLSKPAPPRYLEVRGADGSVQVIENAQSKMSIADSATAGDSTTTMSYSIINSVPSLHKIMPHASDGKYNSYGVDNRAAEKKDHVHRRDGELFRSEQDRIRNEPKRFALAMPGDSKRTSHRYISISIHLPSFLLTHPPVDPCAHTFTYLRSCSQQGPRRRAVGQSL